MRKAGNNLLACLVVPALLVFLAGCGSSGKDIDDGPDYSASPLAVGMSSRTDSGIADNILQFAWLQGYGVDFYRLHLDPDGHSGFTQVGADFYPPEQPFLPDCADIPDGDPAVPGVDCITVLPDCADLPDGEPGVDCLIVLPECDDVPDGDPAVPGVDCVIILPPCEDEADGIPGQTCQPTIVVYNYEQLALHLFSWPDALFMLEACTEDPAECYTVGIQSVKNLSANAIDIFTTSSPNNQIDSTFGISVASSEDGLQLAIGSNTASIFQCDEVIYTDEIIYEDPDAEVKIPIPCQKLRLIEVPSCAAIEDPEPTVNCVGHPEYCIDVENPVPGENCEELPYCEDIADPEEGINCQAKPPFCVEAEEGEECLDELPNCDDRPDGVPGVDCQIIIDCEVLDEDEEELPAQCIVYEAINNAGGVYMYSRASEIEPWLPDGLIKAPNAGENDNFGWDVALSDDGTTLAVSAPGEKGDSSGDLENDDEASAGAAYIYTLEQDEWVFDTYLKAPNAEAEDLFGWDLELSGDGQVLAVSAAREAPGTFEEAGEVLLCEGAVYVYGYAGVSQWPQQAYLKAENPQQNDLFGQSLSLDYTGSLLAVGASQDPDNELLDEQRFSDDTVFLTGCDPDANPANNTGFVSLFERSGTDWAQLSELRASNADAGDRFGYSVGLNSGAGTAENAATRLLVGATRESSAARGLDGEEGNDSLSRASGAAYLFEKIELSNEWTQTHYLKASNTGPTDEFGSAVGLNSSGDVLAIGAWGESGPLPGINRPQEFDQAPGAGAIYFFRENTSASTWDQLAYVKPSGVSPRMGFGWDLELARDGEMLIGAAPGFTSFGSVPGSVFVY